MRTTEDLAQEELELSAAPAVAPGEEIEVKALTVLRRGLALSPELRRGLVLTVVMALTMAIGRLTVPILVQQIIDKGIESDEGFRPGFVYGACAVAALVVLGVMVLARFTYLRLMRNAEAALLGMRVRAFAHIHQLSLADHNESRKGVLTARVTSDIESLAQFMQWGAISWIVNGAVIFGTLLAMAVYAWPLMLIVIGVYVPLVPVLRHIQRNQLHSYGRVRNRVAATLGLTSEAVTGAAVLRAYGYTEPTRRRLHRAVDDQCAEQISAYRWFAYLMPITDLFGVAAMALAIGTGVRFGDDLGLTAGTMIAFVFLVNLVLNPVTELGEVLDQTQTALAAWAKVIGVLDTPIDVVDPDPGRPLPSGPLPVRAEAARFSYRTGGVVLHDVDVEIPAGAHVAVVGETGSGKTTFARLLVRLADPTGGTVFVGDVDLREWPARTAAVRSAWCPRTASSSTPPSARTSAAGGPTRTTRRSTTPSNGSGCAGGSSRCRVASIPPSASAGMGFRWGSGSWCRSRARRSRIPACSCSTRRRVPWIPRPSSRSPTRWPGSRLAGPPSPSRTGSPPRSGPTRCSCSTRAASWKPARTTSWSRTAGSTPACTAAGSATPRRDHPAPPADRVMRPPEVAR